MLRGALFKNSADFKKVFDQAGETGLIELAVGNMTKHVLISEVQINPVSDALLHVDFREVSLKEKIE